MTERERELPVVPALRVLEPPPGGLARVRETIDREAQRASRPRWWLVVAPIAVAAAIVVLIVLGGRSPRVVRSVTPVATADAPLADPAVGASFYWVASQPHSVARRPQQAVAMRAIDSVGTAPVVLMP